MSISLERAALRGKLTEAEYNLTALRLQLEGLCASIRQSLNTALTPVDELNMPQIGGQCDLMEDVWAQYQKTRIDIERLKKELA